MYKYYGVEDGLPSSEVYSAFQDSKGYMWFSTDAGVSRFNGYEFENFDMSDGLTDNTVFLITEDAKGRIWFGTFNCQLSFYEKGSIYSYKYNDKLSVDLKGTAAMTSFYVDGEETIRIGFTSAGLYKIDKNGVGRFVNSGGTEVADLRIYSVRDYTIWGLQKGEEVIRKSFESSFKAKYPWEIKFFNDRVEKGDFVRSWEAFELEKSSSFNLVKHEGQFLVFFDNEIIILDKNKDGKNKRIKTPLLRDEILYSLYSEDEFLWMSIRGKGVFKCRLENENVKVVERFLPKTSVSRIYKDKDNGYWFLTLKKGAIYLSNDKIRHYENIQNSIEHVEVDTSSGNIYKYYNDGIIIRESLIVRSEVDILTEPGRIIYDGDMIFNYVDNSLLVENYNYSKGSWDLIGNLKTGSNMVGKSFLVDSNIIYKVSDFGFSIIKDSREIYSSLQSGVFKMWCTSLAKVGSEIWIGTKDGVRVFSNGKVTNPFIKNKYLSTAITSIKNLDDSILVIGTKSYGLLIVKNDSVVSVINKEKGLISDLIRTIHVDNQGLIWLGSNKGICKITYTSVNDYKIYNITKNHGLISTEIKDIASYENMIYAVTTQGLVQFDKTKLQLNSVPPEVYISSFKMNEKLKNLIKSNEFSYQENNISIVYEGLNYRGLGEVEYQYRMLGVDTNWISTLTRYVRYPLLPPNDYIFEVKAKNEDGFWSKPTTINFTINFPFWLTWWFIVVEIILGMLSLFLVFKYRENQLNKKSLVEKRMVELELRALRSQMNPHFIFNILNSIQHYIIVNDFRSTNRYITQFAKLIRTVLHLSEKSMITIQEEVEMLTLYMDLEKMRFDEQFFYEINISDEIDVNYDEIPSMLIQPYVENSIWHGLMNKEKKGKIKINLSLEKDQLCCVIEDNGIGREKAEEIKSRRNIEQKSVGMSITKERLDLLGGKKVNVKTIDLKDNEGRSLGTKIEIKIPYKN